MNKKIKFYLDKPKGKRTFILVSYYCKDGNFRYSTKESVEPINWDEVNQQTFFDKKVNAALFNIYTIIDKYISFCNRMGKTDIYKSDIKNELNEKLNRKEKNKIAKPEVSGKPENKLNHFFTCLEVIIKEAERGELLTPQLTKYTAGSIKNLKKTRNRLFEFNPNLDFSTIDIKIYHSFVNFCNHNNYSMNYTSALIKDWKTFMELAKKKKFSKNMIHRDKEFKRVDEESFQVYLNDEEIMKLYALDLSDNKYLEQIRDRYIINLYTGYRISDMKTFDLKNIQNDIITHTNIKTGKRVVAPIHNIITEILKKYEGKLPKQYVDQVVNKGIKEIAKKAGLTEVQYFTKTIGGVKIHISKEKWEMITNHTARRSLATNLLKHADFADVMPVMGMSLKTLQNYNKRSAEENARMLKNNPYFNK
jgi:integrase